MINISVWCADVVDKSPVEWHHLGFIWTLVAGCLPLLSSPMPLVRGGMCILCFILGSRVARDVERSRLPTTNKKDPSSCYSQVAYHATQAGGTTLQKNDTILQRLVALTDTAVQPNPGCRCILFRCWVLCRCDLFRCCFLQLVSLLSW